MNRDQVIGALILAASMIGTVIYGWILFFTKWKILLLQITGFVAVVAILGILAWIGYTLATTGFVIKRFGMNLSASLCKCLKGFIDEYKCLKNLACFQSSYKIFEMSFTAYLIDLLKVFVKGRRCCLD